MAPYGDQYHYSDSNSSSRYSDDSDLSRSSAPTSCDFDYRQSSNHSGLDFDPLTSPGCTFDLRASSETYASTVASEEDLAKDCPEYAVPEYTPDVVDEPLASTPPEFAELFPSSRRLLIRHDDTTLDGNMNLRVDTEVVMGEGRKADFTLFHLRMRDLKNRDYSLRRYCRESGREVCHASRRYVKPVSERRPALQRSVSHAVASFLGKQDKDTKPLAATGLKRQDSGYASSFDEGDELDEADATEKKRAARPIPTNTTKLEFSNYAQVNLKRRGAKAGKRYAFEYWGTAYSWRREIRKDGTVREISYHLVNNDNGIVVAHIVPVPLTPAQLREERAKGGWVPPCSMWISDADVLHDVTDVADVIVATGLVALVDDAIKNSFHQKRAVQIVLPVQSKSMKMDYVGPKKLIDEVFHRRSVSRSRERTPSHHITA
ncbi:MAG: hypothetical protein M1832_004536 [Thelocarpon impressellum]|nr:MAG: hypothetical protein M1832_004536 [Thelocarpon impressellum]